MTSGPVMDEDSDERKLSRELSVDGLPVEALELEMRELKSELKSSIKSTSFCVIIPPAERNLLSR